MECVFKKILTALGCVYAWTPSWIRAGMGSLLGLGIFLLGYRRKVVRQNLIRVFPDQWWKYFIGFYSHFGQTLLEMFALFGPSRSFMRKAVQIEGECFLKEALSQKKGVVILTAHLANWEWAVARLALAMNRPLLIVTKILKPKWFHFYMEKNRKKCGVFAVYEPHIFHTVIKTLQKGGVVAAVLDQYAGAPIAVRVPFFGVPVGTSVGLAAWVQRTGSVLLPMCLVRNRGKAVLKFDPPMDVSKCLVEKRNKNYQLATLTAQCVKWTEHEILKHPSQWLWSHRRFKGDLSPLHPNEWNVRKRT